MTSYTNEQVLAQYHKLVSRGLPHTAAMLDSLLADRTRLQAEAKAFRSIEVGGWQVRLTAKCGSEWEACTKECYEDTIRTGRYCGASAGTKDVEVRQLYVFSNGEDGNTRSPK